MTGKNLSERIELFQTGFCFDNEDLLNFYKELNDVDQALVGKGLVFLGISRLVCTTKQRVMDIITARGI